jgi:hypothetical protein
MKRRTKKEGNGDKHENYRRGSVVSVPLQKSSAVKIKKVKFALEQVMNAQRGSRGTALLFL